jgi:catechol 2,3-dioxygenase-like lactoylglutathione lyase family enzyme
MARLDHIHLHVVDGPRMVRFLETVLEAKEGFRPPFEFPGHWVYVDDKPAIHISIVAPHENPPRGIIGHVAFGVYDYEATKARIESTGYPWRLAGIPDTDIGQFFVDGPEGLLLEVQYRR